MINYIQSFIKRVNLMLNRKNQKLAFFVTIFLTSTIMALTVSTNFYTSIEIIEVNGDYDNDSLRIAATFGDITIDALLTTNTSTNGNWTWAKDIGLCTGLGTLGNPYRIQGHTFDNTYAMDDCLRILNSRDYFEIRDCTFISAGFMSAGIYLSNVTNGRIIDSFSYDNYIGIEMEFVNNTELSGNHIYITTAGLTVDNSHFNTISNNNISANIDIGVYLTQSTYNTISYNLLNDNQNFPGIWVVLNSNNNDILHNTANRNGQSGISIDTSSYNTISYNEVNENGQYGIFLDDGDHNTLLSNIANDNGQYGIIFVLNSDFNTISQNTANNNNITGIYGFLCFNIDLNQNLANHNDWSGIQLDLCGDSTIYKNTAYDNTLNGIYFLLGSNFTFTDNSVYENKNNGILFNSIVDSVIENNYAHHNGMNGISLEAGCSRNIIESNTLRYNNLSGIFLGSLGDDNIVMNNLATNNVDHGIYLLSADNNIILDNTASSNGMNGIHLESSNDNTILGNTANNNKNGTFLVSSNNNKIINNILLGNFEYCYNETGGSIGNIFEGNVCTGAIGGPAIDLSTVLLILCIIEGAFIGVIIAVYFVRKRKPKT